MRTTETNQSELKLFYYFPYAFSKFSYKFLQWAFFWKKPVIDYKLKMKKIILIFSMEIDSQEWKKFLWLTFVDRHDKQRAIYVWICSTLQVKVESTSPISWSLFINPENRKIIGFLMFSEGL